MTKGTNKLSIYPCILLAGNETLLQLHLNAIDDGRYELRVLPVSYPFQHLTENFQINIHNGKSTITFLPDVEQEYSMFILKDGHVIAESSVYSLEKDLFELNPYKGDFHMHSVRSDGLEKPAEIAAYGREIGLDIMGITDHGQYKPSLEAIDAFYGLKTEFCLCAGEEVHAPGNPVHIVSFGANEEISSYFDTDEYNHEVSIIKSSLKNEIKTCDLNQYASTLWVFRKIRQSGGLSIFCHPYWKYNFDEAPQEYYISEALTTQVLRERQFDAYEVLGGYKTPELDSNTLQVSRYYEERLNGQLPIVGVSDAHGCFNGLFGWYYTMVFAESCDLQSVKKAICSCLSVAVEKLPNREYRVYGPFRLVRYALFLLKEFFPRHDALCSEEGKLMMRWLVGDKNVADEIASLSDQINNLRNNCFGRLTYADN